MRASFKPVALGSVVLCLCACHQNKADVQKRYPFTGKVISINPQEHTAMIDGSAVPNYMDAMKMDYPIPAASDLASLKVGENISATINVSQDGSYNLSDIHERAASETGK